MTTVRYHVRFGRDVAPRARPAKKMTHASDTAPATPTRADRRASAATLLAVAHFVERGLIDGSIDSFNAAAEIVGVSRVRLSQIMGLLDLQPDVQSACCATRT